MLMFSGKIILEFTLNCEIYNNGVHFIHEQGWMDSKEVHVNAVSNMYM